jgi:hypothetical protein
MQASNYLDVREGELWVGDGPTTTVDWSERDDSFTTLLLGDFQAAVWWQFRRISRRSRSNDALANIVRSRSSEKMDII